MRRTENAFASAASIGAHRFTLLTRVLLLGAGTLALLPAPVHAVDCDGTEVVCIGLSSRAEVEASGGVIAGGSFESGGFRPSNQGGIDWSFGPETDFSSGRVAFEVTGLLPTTGGELEGGKTAIFTADGFDGDVLHFMKLQKMLEELLEGHLLRWGFDDDLLKDGFDALIVSSGVFPCGLFQLTDWQADETHSFELGWTPGGVTLTVDDWSCGAAGNGDPFDPPTKKFTLGNQTSHPPAQHADGVFRNFRLWAVEKQDPIAVIESITPSPTTRSSGVVSLSGFADDPDNVTGGIVEHSWRSNRDGLLGSDESVLISASKLRTGLHTITFEAVDDEGESASDQVTLFVTEGEPGIYTIELPASDDAKVAKGDKGDPNTNYGDGDALMAGSGSVGVFDEASFLRFDVHDIPGTVLDATLHLTCLNDGGAQDVFRAGLDGTTGAPWTEDTITWNTAPVPMGGALDSVAGVTSGQSYDFDVSGGVVPGQALSLVLISAASDGGGHHSKEHPDAFEHPMLELRYELEDLRIFDDGFEDGDTHGWEQRFP